MKTKFLLFTLVGLIAVFALGPKPGFPEIDPTITSIEGPLAQIAELVKTHEQQIPNLKSGNAAQLIWADSIRQTPYSIVYLHGFSASPMEGDPLVFDFAKRYGCNLFIARLAGHGLADEEAFANLTPADLINSAKEAIAIGKRIGQRVIVMSCSTGSTLSIYLTAQNPGMVDAQILYSPNIDLEDKTADLLTLPWGLQLARWVIGSNYRSFNLPEGCRLFWTMRYRIEGLICMKALVEECMRPDIFKEIASPYFIGYYYKNETKKDNIISVEAITEFDKRTATATAQKAVVPFENVNSHVILNDCQSEDVDAVRKQTYLFAEDILGMTPLRTLESD